MTVRLTPMILFVTRFDRCFTFYRRVFGLRPVRLFRGREHPPWAEFQTGDIRLALHGDYRGPRYRTARPVAIHFSVEDIHRTIRKIRRYGGNAGTPREIDYRPAELQMVYRTTFKDPDGNEFELQQVIKRFRR